MESHVLTILLYGSENWLSETLLQLLNSFLGEISKKLLKLLKCYSNTCVSIVIGMQTTRALYLTRKHQFLCKVAADNSSETVSLKTFMSQSDNIDSVYIVWECHDLECLSGTSFTLIIMKADNFYVLSHGRSR